MTKPPRAVSRYLAAIGKKGGEATTPAKQAASRANGKKGGRAAKGSPIVKACAVFVGGYAIDPSRPNICQVCQRPAGEHPRPKKEQSK